MFPDLAETALVALDRTALAVLVGLCACWLWLATERHEDTVEASPGLRTLLFLSLLTLLLTATVDLWMRAATLADVGLAEAFEFVPRVVTRSDYGQFWLLRIGAVVLIAMLWLWRRHPALRGVRPLAAFGALLIAFSISSTGHASEDGVFNPLNLLNTLHIVAACVWGGTVVVYALTVLPFLRRLNAGEAIAATAVRLSTLAGSALAVVVATGLYHAWVQIETVDALLSTDYGWILLIKLLFVTVMAGIGALNRFVVVPAIEAWAQPPRLSPNAEGPPRVFLNRLRLDIAVFIVILACAAALGNATPARHVMAAAGLPFDAESALEYQATTTRTPHTGA